MRVPLRFRVLDGVRRKVLRGEVAAMSHDDILAARGPHVQGGAWLQRLAALVTGRPRGDVERSTLFLPGAEGDLPARLHRPAVVAPERPAVLHLPGGGWVVGGPVQYDWFCGELAAELGALVVSLDYRKAPEHAAPAAAEDCAAVATWLLEGGVVELGAPGPLVVAGDSAGGNLAALTALAVRDAGLAGLAAQLLVYPGTDLTLTSHSATTQTDEPILTRTDMEAFVAMYLAGEVEPADPRVSPLHVEDLSGVAPACVQTAEHDPLRDEGRAYAERLAAAGVAVRHTEYAGMPHGFTSLPGLAPAAHQAVAELVQFTRPLIT